MPSRPLELLNPSLHQFDPARFGTRDALRAQSPTPDGWRALLVACSETGFAPDVNSIFGLGELYILQNFGNIMEGLTDDPRDETQATAMLCEKQIQQAIVCGHLKCRTVGHFLETGERDLTWLKHGDPIRKFMASHYADLPREQALNVAAQENVLIQVQREIDSQRAAGVTSLVYAWVLDDETQLVHWYHPETGQFELL